MDPGTGFFHCSCSLKQINKTEQQYAGSASRVSAQLHAELHMALQIFSPIRLEPPQQQNNCCSHSQQNLSMEITTITCTAAHCEINLERARKGGECRDTQS